MSWYKIDVPFLNSFKSQKGLIEKLVTITGNGFEEDISNKQYIFYCLENQLPQVRKIIKEFRACFITPVCIEPFHEQDWKNIWKKFIQPVQAGVFYIHPPWYPDRTGSLNITINPAMAFGTGTHPSTQGALQYISGISFKSTDSLLDIGTGSGILSFAAVLKGCPSAWAVDNDPVIYENFNENRQLNRLENHNINLMIEKPELIPLHLKFEYIVINMLPQNFFPFKNSIYRLVSTRGKIFYSGFPVTETTQIIRSLQKHDFQCLEYPAVEGWGSVLISRRGVHK